MIESTRPTGEPASEAAHDELEEYAGGYIKAWVGRIPPWLLVVYTVLFIWALYYLVHYWGGLGPGRPG
ncbi:MAG: hypothetical protein WCF20_14845 [Methylovirgula sp.]